MHIIISSAKWQPFCSGGDGGITLGNIMALFKKHTQNLHSNEKVHPLEYAHSVLPSQGQTPKWRSGQCDTIGIRWRCWSLSLTSPVNTRAVCSSTHWPQQDWMKFIYDNNFQAKFSDWWLSYPHEIALRWMSLDLTDDKSTLVQKMGSHYQGLTYQLPNIPGQVEPPVRQVDLNKVILYILWKENRNVHQFRSQAIENLGFVEPCITWANADADLCHHVKSLDHNELRIGDIWYICCYLSQFLFLLQVHTLCSDWYGGWYGWLKIFNSWWTIREIR